MRMFVAVTPPDGVVEHLSEFLESRQQEPGPLRWSSPPLWHITLAFMAEVPDSGLDEFTDQLTELTTMRSSFGLRLQGAGAFPNPAAARVLWIGLDGQLEPLRRLATASRSAAARSGLRVEGGEFRPHLTVARANRPVEVTRWLRVLELYRGPGWQVEQLSLVQSQLGGGGRQTTHQSRAVFELDGPG